MLHHFSLCVYKKNDFYLQKSFIFFQFLKLSVGDWRDRSLGNRAYPSMSVVGWFYSSLFWGPTIQFPNNHSKTFLFL